MRQSRQVVWGINNEAPSLTGRIMLFLALVTSAMTVASGAFAATTDLTSYVQSVSKNTDEISDIFNYCAFILGVILGALGIMDLKKHVESPGSIPLKHALTKLAFGGIFLGLPFAVGMVQATMMDTTFSASSFLKKTAYSFGTATVNNNALSGIIKKGVNNAGVLVGLAAFAAYTIGVFFVFRGLQMLRGHIDNPGNAPLAESLKRLGVGGALLSLPMVANIVLKTFGASGSALGNTGWANTPTAGGGGLDGMIVSFVHDIAGPMYLAIEVFCYIAGILLILFAMQRLVKTAQDGPRGPLGFGTITMFIVAGLLLSFPQFVSALDYSLLGGGQALTKVKFMSEIESAGDTTQAKNVFSAVLAFMAVIGLLSIVRGLFLLKSFADGNNQATMMSVVTHLVAGSMAVNLGGVINAVQTSLGITSFPVTFN